MIKLIASDLDGTLVSDDGQINGNVFNIIDTLFEKKIKFVAASGRFYTQLNRNFETVKGNMIIIAHNGALIKYNNMGQTLYSNCISEDDMQSVLNLDWQFEMGMFFAGEEKAYMVKSSRELLKELSNYGISTITFKALNKVKDPIYKISYYVKDGVNELMLDYLKSNLNENLEFVVSGNKWIDIMNKGVSKGQALKIIQEKFKIDEKDTMVFGDYYNDLPMFKVAYHSYAMGNAPDEVKKHARFVAETNNNNGVYNAIQKYALGN